MPRQAKISIPHPVPETVSDRKSRFLFFILAWGRRSKTLEGEPWFVAADVCRALEIDNTATRRLDEDEKAALRLTQTSSNGTEQGRDVTIINEPGLYALVLSSRKPKAKAFKRWITHEVIPQDRRLHCRSGDDNTDLVTYGISYALNST